MIDMRSDTVTLPSSEMKAFMLNASLGDDVFGEDPTVNELERYAANLFGKDAALFCSSGTQTNQLALMAHLSPADEVICAKLAHIYQYEGGGIMANAHASVKLLGDDRGMFTAADVEAAVNPNDLHKPKSKLVSIENTSNKGGGATWELSEIKHIKSICDKHNLSLHLDGARVFNSIVANNENKLEYGELFHSISICLSKGLGAPVGSVLLGSKAFISKAKRIRKRIGGGMRQAGIIAAGGLYALQHNVDRLKVDHEHAKKISTVLTQQDYVKTVFPTETNIIILVLKNKTQTSSLLEKWKELGLFGVPFGEGQIRLVTHLDISPTDVEKVCSIIQQTSIHV